MIWGCKIYSQILMLNLENRLTENNLNCIKLFTNSCNLYTYVTLRGNEFELPEDNTIVSKHVGDW